MAGFLNDMRSQLRTSSLLTRLIIVNAAVFVLANVIHHIFKFPEIKVFLAVPSSVMAFIHMPWTIITYMFMHADLGHVFFNMMVFYMFGRIFTEYLGSKRLLSLYILGGLSGAILYMAVAQFIPGLPVHGLMVGASASIMAIMIAVAVYVPNYVVHLFLFGPVKLKYLALIMFILTSIIDFTMNAGGKVAHIGGALMGLLFMIQYKKGRDITTGLSRLIGWITSLFSRQRKSNLRVKYKKKVTDEEYNASRLADQQVIDAILDKISKSGYESLTKREKEILFRASNKDKH